MMIFPEHGPRILPAVHVAESVASAGRRSSVRRTLTLTGGAHDVIQVAPQGEAEPSRAGPHDQSRTIRTIFANACDGYSAVHELRLRGFRIDLEASIAGDLIVCVQAERTRADEVGALVAAHDGRIA